MLQASERLILSPQEIVTGYLICDLSRFPRRYFPRPRNEGNRYAHSFTQWSVYRVEFDFEFGFLAKGSLALQNEEFYRAPNHWKILFEKETENLTHRSDHFFTGGITADSIHNQSQEGEIPEFQEPGLYQQQQ